MPFAFMVGKSLYIFPTVTNFFFQVLEENIDWEDVQWSQTGVWVAGKEYQLARVHFLSQN